MGRCEPLAAFLRAPTGGAMIKFGTDGWRGVIGDDFIYDNIWKVACAIARYVRDGARGHEPLLLVGYDTRFGSDRYAQLCAIAAKAYGVPVKISSRFTTTPAISFATRDMGTDGAIMITASHNPSRFDGVKFKAPYGGSATAAIMAEIESHLRAIEKEGPPARPDIMFEDALEPGKLEFFDPVPAYVDKVVSMVDPSVFPADRLKVLFDPMYGAGQNVFPMALEKLGMPCEQIHAVHNPLFPGLQPEPIGDNLDELTRAVVAGGFSVGIAVDGDADRVTAVDATGRWISSHMVLALMLKHLVEFRKWTGDVVKTVSTTSMIDMLCEKYGRKLYVVPVGFKYIADLMLEEDIVCGGEESGGTGMKNYLPERDGIMIGLMLIEIMAANNKTLGELVDDIMDELGRRFVYLRKDVELTRSHKESLLGRLHEIAPSEILGRKVVSVEAIDGVKFHLNDGTWLMLRVSGTEPMVRVYAEAESEAGVESLVAAGRKLVDSVAPEGGE